MDALARVLGARAGEVDGLAGQASGAIRGAARTDRWSGGSAARSLALYDQVGSDITGAADRMRTLAAQLRFAAVELEADQSAWDRRRDDLRDDPDRRP